MQKILLISRQRETLQLGKEQITYTGKQSDRFTGCTRGVNGTTAQSHDTNEPYFRSA